MRPSLRSLLDHPIDYAGLFPPAQHSMRIAIDEYLDVIAGQDNWIVDRFVCNAEKLDEMAKSLKSDNHGPLRVTVIGSSPEKVKDDGDAIKRAVETGRLVVEAYEIKIAQGEGLQSEVSAAKKLPKLAGDESLEVYLEVGWGDGMADAMHDATSLYEDVGFKGRTGGLTADAFPSVPELAAFISECSSLECPFKFTAGIHDPIRHYDEDLGTYRHGFLNVILASALATSQDLNRREIEAVLALDEPSKMHFGADDIRVGEHWLEAEQVEEFWGVFGGFGSCSIDEPIQGLRKLGLLG